MKISFLSPLAPGALAFLLLGCIFDAEDSENPFVTKDGPSSLSKGVFRNIELNYSFVHPGKGWTGGLLPTTTHSGDYAHWSANSGPGSVMVNHFDSAYSLIWVNADTLPDFKVTTRQGVKVRVYTDPDSTSHHLNRYIAFHRNNKLVMIWLSDSLKNLDSNPAFRAIDSSLTFF
jgi:hypothetical protein